ncbi:hypothetical protein [Clostridium sulfidigenes]|uniref:hypothetical protein n=1 Tax=Clostridium sulfidigenes TaxID=318464 RepID=UPI000ACE393D|nr:hypothetical protein [Clostridium sulfidigenes]
MEQMARAERNAYMREWRKNNQDKVKMAQKRYWEKRAKKLSGKSRKDEGSQDRLQLPI